jgi:predicted restriction endonuclease
MNKPRKQGSAHPIGKIAYIQFGDKSGVYSDSYIDEFKNGEWDEWGTPSDYLNNEKKGILLLYDRERKGITIELRIFDTVEENGNYPYRNKFKLNDIKIFEPEISLSIIQKIHGLENFGKTQTPKWNLFKFMYDTIMEEYNGKATSIMKDRRGNKIVYSLKKEDSGIEIDGVDPSMRKVVVNSRHFQAEFRRNIMAIFNNHCLFCDVDSDILLEAAHIIPVNKDLKSAGKFANGICLCSIHHKLFDEGFVSIFNNRIVVNEKMKKLSSEYMVSQYKKLVENEDLILPVKNESDVYLKWHYENVFSNL